MQSIKLGSVRQDVATGLMVTRFDLKRDGRATCYPCRVEAPEAAPRDWIEAALTRHALPQPDTGRPRARPL